MNELSLIKKISSLLPDSSYIGDDTAYLNELGIVVTTDTLVEDVHFRLKTTTPYNLGYKSMAVNLSDIASDGAIPSYAFVSLSLPKYIDENFVEEFYKGMRELCSKFGVTVAGGDITGSEKLFINITLIGKTNGLTPARRSNAKVGDVVAVSGVLGSSRAGLEILENPEKFFGMPEKIKEKFINAHQKPFPYVELGRKILENSPSTPAMMDTSDGLGDALYKIAQASGISIEIDANTIPVDEDLEKVAGENTLNYALFGGEDYTLLACLDEKTAKQLIENSFDIKIIGKVTENNSAETVKIITTKKEFFINEKTLTEKCFNHF